MDFSHARATSRRDLAVSSLTKGDKAKRGRCKSKSQVGQRRVCSAYLATGNFFSAMQLLVFFDVCVFRPALSYIPSVYTAIPFMLH